MLPYPQLHVRMDTVGEPYTTITLLINEDSLETFERQLDVLDDLIAHYGARAFYGRAPGRTSAAGLIRCEVYANTASACVNEYQTKGDSHAVSHDQRTRSCAG